jgi:hypothetical protein
MHHRRKLSLLRLRNHPCPVARLLAFEHPGHHRSLTVIPTPVISAPCDYGFLVSGKETDRYQRSPTVSETSTPDSTARYEASNRGKFPVSRP